MMDMTMTCAHFLELLDAYLDRELAAEAMDAAERHRAGCPSCDGLVAEARTLQSAVRRTVSATAAPSGLEARIRRATVDRGRWIRISIAAVAASLLLAALGAAMFRARVERHAANAMDQMALRLDDNSEVELHGILLCRDCELERRYGIAAPCKRIGHHGAIATPDGRIWNLVDQKTASDLIHNERLFGHEIVVRGRLFRGARALVVESYYFQS